jgi:transposase
MIRYGKEADVKKYRVTLEAHEREELQKLISRGKGAAKKLARARILLQADESPGGAAQQDESISRSLNVSSRTVERVRQQFVEEGLEMALNPRPSRRVYQRRLDGEAEAQLIALACSDAPEGRKCWTLRLLADRMVELSHVERVSHETVRQTLKKTR